MTWPCPAPQGSRAQRPAPRGRALLAVSLLAAAPLAEVTEFSPGLNAGSSPQLGIAPGPDGNVWFTDGASAIGRITPGGAITEFSTGLNAGSFPYGIAPGLDGNLWFTDAGTTAAIGRITPSGSITEFSSGLNAGSNPNANNNPDRKSVV